MARPQIIVNGGAPGAKASVAAGASVTFTLESTIGVRSVQWTVLSTDETASVGDYTLTPSGSLGQIATTAALGEGTAFIVRVVVNNGLTRGQPDPTGTAGTVKVFVPTVDGLEVGAAGETYESDPVYGTTTIMNSAIRAMAGVTSALLGLPIKSALVAATSNIALSGGATIDGIALADGDEVLPVAQTAPEQNGLYVVNTGGAWTRATDFDSQDEIRGAIVVVVAGTVGAGRVYKNTNAGSIVVGTTALAFAQMTNVADKAKLDAATSTPTLNTIAMWDSAAAMNATSFKGPGVISTLGVLRAANGATFVGVRNAANGGDISVLAGDGADGIRLGADTAAVIDLEVAGGSFVRLVEEGLPFLSFERTTGATFSNTGSFVISQAAPSGSSAGSAAEISAQNATTSGAGGDLNLRAGAPAGAGNAGVVRLDGGIASTDQGGEVVFAAGSAGDYMTVAYDGTVPGATLETIGEFALSAVGFSLATGGTGRLVVVDSGVAFGNLASFGGGAGVLFVQNASVVPTTNPSGGGILYASGGALFWRGSGGTITPIAPA
jgi:hypothetical protein